VTETKLIVNLTRDRCVCVGELANRPLSRMRGLMGRRGLPAGEGLLISPAPAIHTAFMRFPIDALFVDRELRVLEVVERLRPWRIASKRGAHAVLELPAGECARRGVQSGDRLALRDRAPACMDGQGPEHADGQGGAAGPANAADANADGDADASGMGVVASGTEVAERYASEADVAPVVHRSGGQLVRLRPLRVLVASPDRHFHTVMSLLLGRHNCAVTVTANMGRVGELVDRERIEVVVIDTAHPLAAATVATVEELGRPIGVVLIADEAGAEEASSWSAGRPVLAKWGPFEELVAAIERADQRRGTRVRQP
jgi:uncharacterized protein